MTKNVSLQPPLTLGGTRHQLQEDDVLEFVRTPESLYFIIRESVVHELGKREFWGDHWKIQLGNEVLSDARFIDIHSPEVPWGRHVREERWIPGLSAVTMYRERSLPEQRIEVIGESWERLAARLEERFRRSNKVRTHWSDSDYQHWLDDCYYPVKVKMTPTLQELKKVGFDARSNGKVTVDVTLRGNRPGTYKLRLLINGSGFHSGGHVTGDAVVELSHPQETRTVPLEYWGGIISKVESQQWNVELWPLGFEKERQEMGILREPVRTAHFPLE